MILLVDDDDGVRSLIEQILRERGHTVINAENGNQALSQIQHQPQLSLLITDIRMPGIDGWEVARQAIKLRPNIKVMYITGYREDAPADVPNGPLLRKPWRMSEFYTCVEQLVG